MTNPKHRHRPERLWRVPAYLPYVQPPLTPSMLAAAEAQLGVTLPELFVRMLRAQNGGHLRAVWPTDVPHSMLHGIGPDFPSITGRGWWREGAADEWWMPEQGELLVSFDGDGHWELCFDYREHGPDAEPRVTVIDSEAEEESRLVDSFADFLDGLVDELEASALRIHAEIGLEECAARLGQAAGVEFVDKGAWNQGHRVFAGRLGNDDGYTWAWISSNRVPAGYRRDGDEVIASAETALRLPDDPDCSILVTFQGDADVLVREAIRRAGLA